MRRTVSVSLLLLALAACGGGGDESPEPDEFAELAKRYSVDTATKQKGGRLTISKGQTVAPFERVAFSLETNEISRPVQTEFGWHVIQAFSPVRPARTRSLSEVERSIRNQLLTQKRQAAYARWLDGVREEFERKTRYAAGYAPAGVSARRVPQNAVAVVGSDRITKAELDQLLQRTRNAYEAQNRPFPSLSSPEYKEIVRQAVAFLVQRSELTQKAQQLGVRVSEQQVTERLTQIKEEEFGGSERRYRAQLRRQGLTEEQLRVDIRTQLTETALYERVTAGVEVSEDEVTSYYDENRKKYRKPASRDVGHILVRNKQLASRLYRQLTD